MAKIDGDAYQMKQKIIIAALVSLGLLALVLVLAFADNPHP
jgi:hypothetical protein